MENRWTSKLGFILSAAGSAVGLGNIWRFPYLLAQYGSIFLYMYLICVVGLGFFILISILAFGRSARTDLLNGFDELGKQAQKKISKLWTMSGSWIATMNSIFILAVYLIVTGWTLCYTVTGLISLFSPDLSIFDQEFFNTLKISWGTQFFWVVCAVSICFLILTQGIQKGIERICSILMPSLFVLLAILAGWLAWTTDLNELFHFLFYPDLAKIGLGAGYLDFSLLGNMILASLGQAMYSLSIGFGVMYVYGSYMQKDVDIVKSVKYVVAMDTMVAFLAGFVVVGAFVKADLPLSQGPTLTFVSMPLIFNNIQGGIYLSFVFFLLLFMAALTSIISMYEPLINILVLKKGLSRSKATFYVVFFNIITSSLILLSFCHIVDWEIFGKNLFDFSDQLTGSYTIPLVIAVYSLFMGWKIFPCIVKELKQGRRKEISISFQNYLSFLLKFLIPIVIGALLLSVFIG